MVFEQFRQPEQTNNNVLIYLGAPEAEAEALNSSKMPLREVYKDYCGLISSLSNEKFILIGRKGAGKSAFAEYIMSLAEKEPNLFSSFIRQNDSNLEHLVQIGASDGHKIEKENLYKWIIYTNILKLFTKNEAVISSKKYIYLEKFLKKNSGYIDIRESEIRELVSKEGWDINIDFLKRFFTSKLNKTLEIKQAKAPFYKLLPHLKEVILEVLQDGFELENRNTYIIFFDDLDIAFDANDQNSVESLVSLLRVTKEVNNDMFDKYGIKAKIVILLRDDIAKKISTVKSDTAKLISSYGVHINWYQELYQSKENELSSNIRQFLNDRINYAFLKNNIDVNSSDPWINLVRENSHEYDKSMFKYILDHTFFRPRDLILFFKPLSDNPYKLPLNKDDVNFLIKLYCQEVILELQNELSSFYNEVQISTIFQSLMEINLELKSKSSISYDDTLEIFEKICSDDIDIKLLIEDLFDRSMIGNIYNNKFVYFKHREPNRESYKFNRSYDIILHGAIRAYCNNKGY